LASYTHGPLSVLANTVRLQATKHTGLGIVAANTFAPGVHHAGRLAIDGPASVLLRTAADGTLSIAVCDPTTTRRTVSLVLHGRALRPVSADDAVHVRRVPGGTRLDVTTHHAYGRTFTATLRRRT
jgi:hyaluronate lyase